ncbi:uncharacterized protein TNCV_3973341 [Trichonephila clavipes]|nr:uncharacterized protein TNCV_3973341 [Trichonephila clavipes]
MPVVIFSFEQHTGDSTIWLGSTTILREKFLEGGQEPSTTLPFPLTSLDDSRFDGYLEYPHAAKAIYKNSCLLRDSNPGRTFGLAIHQNDHQARRRFVEWAQNEIAVVPDFHKRILFSDEAHFWLNGYVNKQNCRIWSEANPQVYVETPLHPEKLTVWCALWAGGILIQKR